MYKVVLVASQIKKVVVFSSIFILVCISLTAPAASAQITNSTPCQTLPDFGGQELILEEGSTTVTFVGFPKRTIKYISAPNQSFPVLKIKAASEKATVAIVGNSLTLTSSDSCEEATGSTSTSSPGSTTPASPPTTAPTQVTSSAAAALGIMMIPFIYPSSISSPFLLLVASLFLASTSMLVAGAEDVCEPAIDVEISMPYDCPYNNFVDGVCYTPTQIADKLVQAVFVDFDVEAARELMAEDYIQHYPFVPTGAAPVLGLIPLLPESGLAIETHRTIAEGNLVAYHSTYTNATLFGGETLIAFDVFRVEDGKVQEHWDNLQELAGPNPSGRTMTDGPTMIKYLGQTQDNKALGTSMIQNVLIEGNLSSVPEFLSTVTYTQHNPSIADGLDGLAAALDDLAEQGLAFIYNSIELVVAEGNFVLVGSLGSFGENNPTAYYDLFRMEDGRIVEHWDVLQAVPPDDQFAHSNGKF